MWQSYPDFLSVYSAIMSIMAMIQIALGICRGSQISSIMSESPKTRQCSGSSSKILSLSTLHIYISNPTQSISTRMYLPKYSGMQKNPAMNGHDEFSTLRMSSTTTSTRSQRRREGYQLNAQSIRTTCVYKSYTNSAAYVSTATRSLSATSPTCNTAALPI